MRFIFYLQEFIKGYWLKRKKEYYYYIQLTWVILNSYELKMRTIDMRLVSYLKIYYNLGKNTTIIFWSFRYFKNNINLKKNIIITFWSFGYFENSINLKRISSLYSDLDILKIALTQKRILLLLHLINIIFKSYDSIKIDIYS
jgi:hypothetical protein